MQPGAGALDAGVLDASIRISKLTSLTASVSTPRVSSGMAAASCTEVMPSWKGHSKLARIFASRGDARRGGGSRRGNEASSFASKDSARP